MHHVEKVKTFGPSCEPCERWDDPFGILPFSSPNTCTLYTQPPGQNRQFGPLQGLPEMTLDSPIPIQSSGTEIVQMLPLRVHKQQIRNHQMAVCTAQLSFDMSRGRRWFALHVMVVPARRIIHPRFLIRPRSNDRMRFLL